MSHAEPSWARQRPCRQVDLLEIVAAVQAGEEPGAVERTSLRLQARGPLCSSDHSGLLVGIAPRRTDLPLPLGSRRISMP